ncbi:hypothetical protein Bca101_079656 [Brassica carinata]
MHYGSIWFIKKLLYVKYGIISLLPEGTRKHQKDLSFCLLTHNPTGTDPTPEQWAKIADVIQEKNHIPFLDVAYQGFASGSLDEDATSLRLFAERGMEQSMLSAHQPMLLQDKSGKDWSFILKQIGMFSFTGLNKAQSDNMTNKWHVYMTKDGRISLAALSTAKCEYLADAIIDSYHSVS